MSGLEALETGLSFSKPTGIAMPRINTQINIDRLMELNPRHACCNLVILPSPSNPRYTGLYCQEHHHNFQWLNPVQVRYLEQEFAIPNPQGCESLTFREYEISRECHAWFLGELQAQRRAP